MSEPSFNYPVPGNYIISLKAFSESGNKQSVATKTVTVTHKTGKVSFWQSGTPSYPVTKVIVNDVIRYITVDFPSGISGCTTEGCANFTLPSGVYSYNASAGLLYTWEGTIIIWADECLMVKLL